MFHCRFCSVIIPGGFTQAQTRHGLVDGQCAHQTEVMHADQMQQEVPAQVLLHDNRAIILHEKHAGLSHLIVSYKSNKEEGGKEKILFLLQLPAIQGSLATFSKGEYDLIWNTASQTQA